MNIRLTVVALLLSAVALSAQAPNLVIQDLEAPSNYNAVGGFDALSLGVFTCNAGNTAADWNGSTAAHPVFTQNLYRLENNRFEQVGLSWARHATLAVPAIGCGATGNPGFPGNTLSPGFGDRLSAGLMAFQAQLGPRGEIDPVTGQFPFPPSNLSTTGDATFKRLRVATSDVSPGAHPLARYFGEGVVVSADDAAGGNRSNNRSWRELAVAGGPNNVNFSLAPSSMTAAGESALQAWRQSDPSVQLFAIDVPGDGRFIVAFRGEVIGTGYAYEFAVANIDSARGARSFRVATPDGATLSAVGFHDVGHHSGEPFDGTDWAVSTTPGEISWSTDDFATNVNANALRWGTLYNFRFESDQIPAQASVDIELELFGPGTAPALITANIPPITTLSVVAGDGQASNVNTVFGEELTVEAIDNFGNPVVGISVDFLQTSGTPLLFPNGTTAITDANGIARLEISGGNIGGAITLEASSLSASAPVSFDVFVRQFSRQFFPNGILLLRLITDLPNQAMTFAIDEPSIVPEETPFGTVCTSICSPGPSFYAESGFEVPFAGFVPTMVTNSTGSLLRVYTGLISLVGSGVVVNHQAYSLRVVNGELDIYISNCITATY